MKYFTVRLTAGTCEIFSRGRHDQPYMYTGMALNSTGKKFEATAKDVDI